MNPLEVREIDRLTLNLDNLDFEPVRDLILVEEIDDSLTTGGGIHIPGKLKQSKFTMHRVLAVGPGIYRDGVQVPVCVKVGDTVTLANCEAQDVPGRHRPTFLVSSESVTSIVRKKVEGN